MQLKNTPDLPVRRVSDLGARRQREESPGRRSQKAVAGCKVEAIVGG